MSHPHTHSSARRLLLAGAFAAAAVTLPGFAAATNTAAHVGVNVADCQSAGATVSDGNSCSPAVTPPLDNTQGPSGITQAQDSLPEVDGIPCTATNRSTCIGLSEQPTVSVPTPDNSVDQSP